MMWQLVTLTEGQVHSLYLKIGKYPFILTIFDNISDTIYSRVLTLGPKVACEESLKIIWTMVTLTLVKVTVFTVNLENIHFLIVFDNISYIFHSRVMILGQKVACGETFKMMWYWVTLTFGQGHNNYMKIWKKSIFENMLDSIHS